MYVIKFTDGGLADVKALPKNVRNSLQTVLLQKLAPDPVRHSTELREPLQGFRSLHWRKYRVVFKIFEELKIIAMAGIGERSPQSRLNIYRRLEELAAKGKLAESVLSTLRGSSPER